MNIDEQIAYKKAKLKEINDEMQPLMRGKHYIQVALDVRELQEQLEYRVKQYELKLLDEKIEVYGKVLSMVKPKV